jgi:hypothetical protein
VFGRSADHKNNTTSSFYIVASRFVAEKRCSVALRIIKSLFPTVPLLLRVDSLPLDPVCLQWLPNNGSTRYNLLSRVLVTKDGVRIGNWIH